MSYSNISVTWACGRLRKPKLILFNVSEADETTELCSGPPGNWGLLVLSITKQEESKLSSGAVNVTLLISVYFSEK